jgi:anthranilate synthase
MPEGLVVTAETADGTVMAIEHSSLPMAAVQFHPESVMTSPVIGLKLIENALWLLAPGTANLREGRCRATLNGETPADI